FFRRQAFVGVLSYPPVESYQLRVGRRKNPRFCLSDNRKDFIELLWNFYFAHPDIKGAGAHFDHRKTGITDE
ncbi:MAG: hypothetical protein D3910_20520, partial [Candidatus Electrothrix sp. ATG2]|nr:hypothetical protein [Candidatus Electrothrix sp. ATG2]